jgi:amidohydrolase
VEQFQGIISRLKDPGEKAVLSVGSIRGGTAPNIIADKVELRGTVRSFSFEVEDSIEKQMRVVLDGLALAWGIKYDFRFDRSAQYVKNDPELTAVITDSFRKLLGSEKVLPVEPLTIAEDFSAYSHKIPSVFFFLGTGGAAKLHGTDFAVNEEIFKSGPLLFCSGALRLLDWLAGKK